MYTRVILHSQLGTNWPSRQAVRLSSVLSPLEPQPNSHPLSTAQVHAGNGQGGLSHGLAREHPHATMTASMGFDLGAYTAGGGGGGGGGGGSGSGGGGGGTFGALSGFAQPLGVLRESASKEGGLNELGGGGGGGGGGDADAVFPLGGMAAGGLQQFPSGGGMHHDFPSVRLRFPLQTGPHRCPHPFSAANSKHVPATRFLCGGVRCDFDARGDVLLRSSPNMGPRALIESTVNEQIRGKVGCRARFLTFPLPFCSRAEVHV